MKSDEIVLHLASVLGDNFRLTLEDIENEETEAEKEIVYGMICLHDDLKFYKKRSELLLDNLKNTLFNSAAITITGRNGVIKEVNDNFEQLSGYKREELYGKKLNRFDHHELQSEEYKNIVPTILSGKTWRGEVCAQKKSGDVFWLNTNIFPIRNTEGDIFEFWSVSTDITEKKEVQQKLINKNAELEQFSYMLSHDLKAPGRQIDQLAQFIQEDFSEEFSEECNEMFRVLRSSAKKLNHLIDGILEYSRADLEVEEDEEIDTAKIVESFVQTTVIPDNIAIELGTLPTIMGNSIKVEQVFDNLLTNAIKYAKPAGGSVKISCETNNSEYYKFEIKDEGIGIEARYLSSIFDMLVTAHATNREDSTGIGLALVKKIVQGKGGTVGCDSTLGEGSTFWFTWPK